MEYIYQSNPKDPPYIWYKGGGSKMKKIPYPMRTWADEFRLAPELLSAVERARYKKPSPIQTAAIPLGLQQCDVIGIAETSSGKKAAFVLPILTYVSTRLPPMPRSSDKENQGEGSYALVLAPTREIALQIEHGRMMDMGFGPLVVGCVRCKTFKQFETRTAAKTTDLSTQHVQERRVWQQQS